MLPIDNGPSTKVITFKGYTSSFPAPTRGALKPSQIVLSNTAVGFLPVPTRLDSAVDLINVDEPLLALQAMQVDYRVNKLSESIEDDLAAAGSAARAEEAATTW